MLLTDAESSAVSAAQDEVAAKANPNPYEGMLTVNGLTDQQAFETPTMQKCVKTYEDATAQKVIAPEGPEAQRPTATACRCTSRSPTCAASSPCSSRSRRRPARTSTTTTGSTAANSLGARHRPAVQPVRVDQDRASTTPTTRFALVAFDSAVNDFSSRSRRRRPNAGG